MGRIENSVGGRVQTGTRRLPACNSVYVYMGVDSFFTGRYVNTGKMKNEYPTYGRSDKRAGITTIFHDREVWVIDGGKGRPLLAERRGSEGNAPSDGLGWVELKISGDSYETTDHESVNILCITAESELGAGATEVLIADTQFTDEKIKSSFKVLVVIGFSVLASGLVYHFHKRQSGKDSQLTQLLTDAEEI